MSMYGSLGNKHDHVEEESKENATSKKILDVPIECFCSTVFLDDTGSLNIGSRTIPAHTPNLGVCLSGGGLRAAVVGIGLLQQLYNEEEEDERNEEEEDEKKIDNRVREIENNNFIQEEDREMDSDESGSSKDMEMFAVSSKKGEDIEMISGVSGGGMAAFSFLAHSHVQRKMNNNLNRQEACRIGVREAFEQMRKNCGLYKDGNDVKLLWKVAVLNFLITLTLVACFAYPAATVITAICSCGPTNSTLSCYRQFNDTNFNGFEYAGRISMCPNFGIVGQQDFEISSWPYLFSLTIHWLAILVGMLIAVGLLHGFYLGGYYLCRNVFINCLDKTSEGEKDCMRDVRDCTRFYFCCECLSSFCRTPKIFPNSEVWWRIIYRMLLSITVFIIGWDCMIAATFGLAAFESAEITSGEIWENGVYVLVQLITIFSYLIGIFLYSRTSDTSEGPSIFTEIVMILLGLLGPIGILLFIGRISTWLLFGFSIFGQSDDWFWITFTVFAALGIFVTAMHGEVGSIAHIYYANHLASAVLPTASEKYQQNHIPYLISDLDDKLPIIVCNTTLEHVYGLKDKSDSAIRGCGIFNFTDPVTHGVTFSITPKFAGSDHTGFFNIKKQGVYGRSIWTIKSLMASSAAALAQHMGRAEQSWPLRFSRKLLGINLAQWYCIPAIGPFRHVLRTCQCRCFECCCCSFGLFLDSILMLLLRLPSFICFIFIFMQALLEALDPAIVTHIEFDFWLILGFVGFVTLCLISISGIIEWLMHDSILRMVRDLFSPIYSSNTPYYLLSDGGFKENLGLKELIIRQCKVIISLDAEFDPNMTLQGLTEALTQTRNELEQYHSSTLTFEIKSGNIDDIIVHKHKLHAMENCVWLNYKVFGDLNYEGKICYLRTILTHEDDVALKLYARKESTFPQRNTFHQRYEKQDFDAYAGLGKALALKYLNTKD